MKAYYYLHHGKACKPDCFNAFKAKNIHAVREHTGESESTITKTTLAHIKTLKLFGRPLGFIDISKF